MKRYTPRRSLLIPPWVRLSRQGGYFAWVGCWLLIGIFMLVLIPHSGAFQDQAVAKGRAGVAPEENLRKCPGSDPAADVNVADETMTDSRCIEATDHISAGPHVTITSGANVIFHVITAGGSIHLVAGFVAREGSRFHAYIGATPTNQTPIVNAGLDLGVIEGERVRLDASASVDPDGDLLQYRWEQVAGPQVSLDLSDPVHPTFIAPRLPREIPWFDPPGVTLTFQLIVEDGESISVPVNVNVTVEPAYYLTWLYDTFAYVEDQPVMMYRLRYDCGKFFDPSHCDLSDSYLGLGGGHLRQINNSNKRDIILSFPNGHPENPKAIVFLTTGHQTSAHGLHRGEADILTGQRKNYKWPNEYQTGKSQDYTLTGNSLYGRLKRHLGTDGIYYILVHDNAANWGDRHSEFLHDRFARFIAAKIGVRTEFIIVAGYSRGGYLAAHVGKSLRDGTAPLRSDVKLYVGVFDGVAGGGNGFGVDTNDYKDNPLVDGANYKGEKTNCWNQIGYRGRQNTTFYFNEVGGERAIVGHALACRNYEAFPSYWTERWITNAHGDFKDFNHAPALLNPFVRWFLELRTEIARGTVTANGFGAASSVTGLSTDYYFDLKDEGKLFFQASWTTGADLNITVFDPDEQLIAVGNSPSLTDESVNVSAHKAGPYRVRVSGVSGGRRTFDFFAHMEVDPNTTGMILFPRERVNGVNAYQREYYIAVDSGQTPINAAINLRLIWANPQAHLQLSLFDPAGTMMASSDIPAQYISTRITSSGRYRIVVASTNYIETEFEIRGVAPLYNNDR
jgi:hypothetical protein